ncbi:uncharacterized protein NKAPD1 isoform X1 [Antennarius striatus]|uniref:uncharacterized protein NKAPD1 isoform X1 n=2 Tax=Antennarius striatus TaxID=241820 RepID=UPI0035B22BD6
MKAEGLIMAKQPLGKTLLRNVIRHTDAHNKIQEEMEMWKMRGWEVQMSHHKHLPDTDSVRGGMHCDRMSNQPRSLSQSRVSEHDDREARYWTRKLYEFESNDPDRWGHSGFKELYPEEFESDSEKKKSKKKIGHHKMKKSKSDTPGRVSKQSKKSIRQKKKKKKKRDDDGKHKKADSDSGSDDGSATKDKERRKRSKCRHKNKKNTKTRKDEDSSSRESNEEEERETRTRSRKKRKQDSHRHSDSGLNLKKRRRKDWKAANEESSQESSGD